MDTKLYLDIRRKSAEMPALIKVAICHKRKTSYITSDYKVLSSQWNQEKMEVINHPQAKQINASINILKSNVDVILMRKQLAGDLEGLSAAQIKIIVECEIFPERILGVANRKKAAEKKNLFMNRLRKFADQHGNATTRKMYLFTGKRIADFMKGKEEKLRFEDMDYDWLMSFEAFLAKTASKNARNILLRNVRAVFNNALDDEITTAYPFRRFKIKPVATAKRSLKVEDLRTLFNYPDVEEYAKFHLDMFKLIFMLIGINVIDLYSLKEVVAGRVEYYRAKTHRFYSIKVEPEAMEIIDRYRGKENLLCIRDTYKDHRNYTQHINDALKKIGAVERKGLGGKKIITPLFPKLSTYWARHTWATIAASLDIPKETIAHALGHGSTTVTDIYIDFDMKKVDDANRKVLNYVLYGNVEGQKKGTRGRKKKS
jgi:site-specific recombinase XerD